MAVQALARHPADLMLFYQPAIDEISHQMLRDALADWPYGTAAQGMLAVYQEVDRQLGRLLEGLEDDDTLLISSDHGHEPIHCSIRPNVLLRQAKLLTTKGDKIDLERTHAVFHSSGWVLIHNRPYGWYRTAQGIRGDTPGGRAVSRGRHGSDNWQTAWSPA
jgi:predicted AlkP superfamily pyrophosphatase or phosphodiesterase